MRRQRPLLTPNRRVNVRRNKSSYANRGAASVQLDLKPLANALLGIPDHRLQTHVEYMLLNAARTFDTAARRELSQRMNLKGGLAGPRSKGRPDTRIYKLKSTRRLEVHWSLRRNPMTITRQRFGASHVWSNQHQMNVPGVTHSAMGGSHTPVKTFMIHKTGGPKIPVAFVRTKGSAREKYRPIFGPSPTAVFDDNSHVFQFMLEAHVSNVFVKRMNKYIDNAVAREKRKWGL